MGICNLIYAVRLMLHRLEDFEAWEADFKRSILRKQNRRVALELDALGKSSPLESCY